MKNQKIAVFSAIGILVVVVGLVVSFLMLTITDVQSKYTSGEGFLYIDEQENAHTIVPIGIVESQGTYRAVAVLGKDAKKIDFSEVDCREKVLQDMVQIAVLGRYPLDAGVEKFSRNSALIKDIGQQWGRPVPEDVMSLFKQYAFEFKTWVDNPDQLMPELPESVKFGNLTAGTFLFYMPFKHGGSVGPVEYTGKDEKTLLVTKEGRVWMIPYKCGNGPAEVLQPCEPILTTNNTSTDIITQQSDNEETYTTAIKTSSNDTNSSSSSITKIKRISERTPTSAPVPVPEPATWITLLSGLFLFAVLLRRR